MKLSTTAIILAASNFFYASAENTAVASCADKIGVSQSCVRTCGSANATDSAYSNLLLQCLDDASGFNIASQLETCCSMSGTCTSSMSDADDCLKAQLANVRSAANNYLGCIYTRRQNLSCPWATFCVNLLTGAAGTGASSDFSVASGSRLATMTANATTCDDMSLFGEDACSTVAGCCEPCADDIAAVVNAVTNDILIPAYGGDNAPSSCSGTCADFTSRVRQLESTGEEPVAAAQVVDPDQLTRVSEMSQECTDSLATDIAAYNHTVAVENFLPCLYKKMGKIMAETETLQQSSASEFSPSVAATAVASAVLAAFA